MASDRSAVTGGNRPAGPGAAWSRESDEGRPGDVREFMIRMWSELLGRSDLTEHSDFFARGGDALLITRLARRITERFGVTVSLRELSRRNLGDQVALVHASRLLSARRATPRRTVTTGEIRRMLVREWGELLGFPDPSEGADFFEHGGDALLITRLVRRIDRELGVALPVRDMLAAPTLAEQTLLLSGLVTGVGRSVSTLDRQSD
ncbi:acyl carrier protein [Streptomyces sp. SM11]|uniref:acyl carrier protein n=1 Tax=Streptomyces sp. SM11 TaxID=565557 RepID=UPI0015E19D41|nr:acyl carrier protein [Streptomyces sp. SM11]